MPRITHDNGFPNAERIHRPLLNLQRGSRVHGATMPAKKQPIIDRFVTKTRKMPNGCIIWTGGTHECGYGLFGADKMSRNGYPTMSRAHRISYELFVGPIPNGLHVLHNCPAGDNRLCVNPMHLFLGTQLDNMRDMHKKGRRIQGALSVHAKLSEEDVRMIRQRCGNGEFQRDVASDYSISQSCVNNIVQRKKWAHVS